jgi:hypothetical protein
MREVEGVGELLQSLGGHSFAINYKSAVEEIVE